MSTRVFALFLSVTVGLTSGCSVVGEEQKAQEIHAIISQQLALAAEEWLSEEGWRHDRWRDTVLAPITDLTDARNYDLRNLEFFMERRVSAEAFPDQCRYWTPPEGTEDQFAWEVRWDLSRACDRLSVRAYHPEKVAELEALYDGWIAKEIGAIMRINRGYLPELSRFQTECPESHAQCSFGGARMTHDQLRAADFLERLGHSVGELETPEAEEARALGRLAARWRGTKIMSDLLTEDARRELSARRALTSLTSQFEENMALSRQIRDSKLRRSSTQKDSVRLEICSLLGLSGEECPGPPGAG